MGIGRSLDEQLATLDAIAPDPESAHASEALAAACASKRNVVVQKAARIVQRAGLRALDDALRAAFARFLPDAARKDKGCLALQAIAEALLDSDARADEVFLAGIRHRQPEPVWGGSEDTAIELRVASALGLVNTQNPDALRLIGDLLADPEAIARAGAARALGFAGRVQEGCLLLRLRCRVGDDPRVLQAAFGSLLALAPGEECAFVADFLMDADLEVAEAAALALGESRTEAAFTPLRDCFENRIDEDSRRACAVGMAMLRREEARAWLLATIEDASEGEARAAIEALAFYRHDESLVAAIRSALAERDDPRLLRFADDALA